MLDIANNHPSEAVPEPTRMDYRRKSRCRQAFTLIEILVVIAVIGILIAIAVIGFRALEGNATRNKTKTALANAASMLAEYEAATAFRQQPRAFYPPTGGEMTTGFDFWKDADPVGAGPDPLMAPIGSLDVESMSGSNLVRESSQAVRNTALLVREMEKVPSVQKMLAQLPTDALMIVRKDPLQPPTPANTIGRVLLDGWNNPIIFVPAVGLGGVRLGEDDDGRNPFVVRSHKVYATGTPPTPGLDVIPPNARPFFASAGADGSFGFIDANTDGAFATGTDHNAGDDNLYSFEN